jgi:O-antigen ligase
MKFAFFFIAVLLAGKDTFQLGDPYLMRGAAQAIALVVGIVVLLAHPPKHLVRKYWPLIGYVLCLCLSAITSPQTEFVFLQIGSLLSLILFGISYFDPSCGKPAERTDFFFFTLIFIYFFVSIGSLVAARLTPEIAFESLYAGDALGYENRFRGLFSKAAMMGAASGLLIGAAWFWIRSIFLKSLLIAPALACLALTQSRTFFIALFVAAVATTWLTTTNKARSLGVGVGIMLVAGLLATASNLLPDQKALSTAFRVNTLGTLTGRTGLWERGIQALTIRPLLGFGFTVGSEGLQLQHSGSDKLTATQIESSRAVARVSLHNGYIQSLLDSGMLGTFFYLSIFIVSLFRLIRSPERQERAVEIFLLLFFSIANLGESLVYSAAVFHSAIFWFLATRALSLQVLPRQSALQTNRVGSLLVAGKARRQ